MSIYRTFKIKVNDKTGKKVGNFNLYYKLQKFKFVKTNFL